MGRNVSSESLCNLPEVTQLECGSVGIQTQVFLDYKAVSNLQ